MAKGIAAREIEFSSTNSVPSLGSDNEEEFKSSLVKRNASILVDKFSEEGTLKTDSDIELEAKPVYQVKDHKKLVYGDKYSDMAKELLKSQIKNIITQKRNKKAMDIVKRMGSSMSAKPPDNDKTDKINNLNSKVKFMSFRTKNYNEYMSGALTELRSKFALTNYYRGSIRFE